MNDTEKQKEGTYDLKKIDNETKEGYTIKNKLASRSKNNKIIIYIIIGILVILLLAILASIFLKKDKTQTIKNSETSVFEETEDNKKDYDNSNNIAYVSCDDNTALLNVRNSTSGDIIDGLSCYKEVIIEEKLEGTETCDNWYKISYKKNNNNYTGYACGTYIKNLEVPQTVLNNARSIIDKANEYYNISSLKAYCGKTNSIKILNFKNNMTGEYIESEYKNIEELKKYILSFLDESLIEIKLELSDINDPKYYDNYYEIEGKLYCRNYSATGMNNNYTNNYDIEVLKESDNKIIVNTAYEYIKEGSTCTIDKLSECSKSDFIYEIRKITIEDNIITKID